MRPRKGPPTRRRTRHLILAGCLATTAHGATYAPPERAWFTLAAEHFLVHYPDGLEQQARHALIEAEAVRAGVESRFGWRPRGPVRLVVTDNSDYPNGAATPLPRNRIILHSALPSEAYGLERFVDWPRLLITHEYMHTVHLDKVSEFPRDLRRVLGRHPLLFPNLYQPRWLVEGLATLLEAEDQPGRGRPGSHYFRALLRMEAMGGVKSWRQVNQPVSEWPTGTTPYLYGMAFMDHLRRSRGEAALRRLLERTSGQPIPFLVGLDFAPALGKDLDGLWEEFTVAVAHRAQTELEAIRAQGMVAGEPVTDTGFATGHPLPMEAGLWWVRDDQVSPKTLMLRGSGGDEPLAWVYGRVRLDHHPRAGLLVSQLVIDANVNQFHDLYRLPPGASHLRRLTRGGRFRHAAWSPDGDHIAAVRQVSGRSELVLLDGNGRLVEVLWRGHGAVLGPLDWSARVGLVAALWRPEARQWDLARFHPDTRRWTLLTDDAAVQTDPRFTAGGTLLYSADHDGVFNIWRIPPAGDRRERLTRVLGGAFEPAMTANGALYYTGLTPGGHQIFHLPDPRPLESVPLPAPRPWRETTTRPPIELTTEVRPYHPTLRPTYWLPLWEYTGPRFLVGTSTGGGDDLEWHRYAGFAAWDLRLRVPEYRLDYRYDRWQVRWQLELGRRHRTFEDPRGRLQRLRATEEAKVDLVRPWLTTDRRLLFGFQGSTRREFDAFTDATPTMPHQNTGLVGIGLYWNNTQTAPLALTELYGQRFDMVMNGEYQSGRWSGRMRTAVRVASPPFLGRQALVFDGVTARAFRGADPFELGGTSLLLGVGSAPLAYGKRRYDLPGHPAGLATGDRLQLGRLAWRFPIRRVERGLMLPPVALRRLHGALFAAAGRTWYAGTPVGDWLTSVGGELYLDTYLGFSLPVNLRLGWARGQGPHATTSAYLQWRVPLW